MADDRQGPYTELFGQDGQEALIFAKTENWLEESSLLVACRKGYVDLEEWR